MSKVIKITDEFLQELTNDFLNSIKTMKLSDGKFTFSKTFGETDRKAKLYFTEKAWLKQDCLVRNFDKEIAWHGVAKRGEEKDTYIIEDILVYPQEVTGVTVTTDQEKYQMWLYQHDDDVFNNIRMQGHSHVNMGTTPSGVDTTLYEQFLGQLDDTMFYIFLIWNKRNEKTIKIYDLAENTLFETKDVEVEVLDGDIGYYKFLNEAKELVQERKFNTASTASGTTAETTGGYKTSPASKTEDALNPSGKKGKPKNYKNDYRNGFGDFSHGYNGYGYYDEYWR